jgi:hypothetical protein
MKPGLNKPVIIGSGGKKLSIHATKGKLTNTNVLRQQIHPKYYQLQVPGISIGVTRKKKTKGLPIFIMCYLHYQITFEQSVA